MNINSYKPCEVGTIIEFLQMETLRHREVK